MGKNIFTRIPERGDACIGRRSDKKIFYITADSYDPSGIDQSVYENQGVVFLRDDEGARVAALESKSTQWCSRMWHYISGQQLDGEEHTATFSIRTASEGNWQTPVSKSLTYKATTSEALAKQLNEFFQADSDMAAQDWYADITSAGNVRVHYDCLNTEQLNGNTSTGIVLGIPLPDVPVLSFGTKKNGMDTAGAICNLSRAVSFYKTDRGTGWAEGGATTEQSLRKQTYPINLPTWLGNSEKNPGDFCRALRAYYGEGEEGWMNFLCSMAYHHPVNRHDASAGASLERTQNLVKYTYTSAKVKTPTVCLPTADYCAGYGTDCVPAGKWYLGDASEVAALMWGVEYGTNSSVKSDVLNRTLALMGGTAISNGQILWSCVRRTRNAAWCASGDRGFFSGGSLVSSVRAVPLSLQPLEY